MQAISTRNSSHKLSMGEAIVMSNCDDGGLYVPSSFPRLDKALTDELTELSFVGRVAKVLSLYIDELPYSRLLAIVKDALKEFDDEPCPIIKVENALYMQELWHGPSCSAADITLAVLSGVVEALSDKRAFAAASDGIGEGRAVVQAFKGNKNVDAVVLFRADDPRSRLWISSEGAVNAVGINGDGEQVKAALRSLFVDMRTRGRAVLGVSNANICRILCETAILISAYCDLRSDGEIGDDSINFAFSGADMSMAVAALYAKKMGLPIAKVIVAFNANKGMADFLQTGIFDARRALYATSSPELDILVPANLERLLFEFCNRDSGVVAQLCACLIRDGKLEAELNDDASLFESGWADDDDVKDALFNFFDIDDCIMDPHTAVAAGVYNEYTCETGDETPTVIVSSSGPYKYPIQTMEALGTKESDFLKATVKLQAATALECPEWAYKLATAVPTCVNVDAKCAADVVFSLIDKE